MDKKARKELRKLKPGRKISKAAGLPFTTKNYQLFGIGILVIILGYISLAQGPVDSFWSLTLAPILLVLGYCVIIPISIIYRDKNITKKDSESSAKG